MFPRESGMGLSGTSFDQGAVDPKILVEPWMKDFVKDRHTQEEWEAFMVYAQAGPWKRAAILLRTSLYSWWWR